MIETNQDQHVIPEMTHPLGSAWSQPDRSQILVDDTHALMSVGTLNSLAEYSTSNPSGVYEGKMWKRHFCGSWFLCWYGFSDKPDFCSTNVREVVLV